MVQIARTYNRNSPATPEVATKGASAEASLFEEFSQTLKQVMFQLSRQGITDVNAINLQATQPTDAPIREAVQVKSKVDSGARVGTQEVEGDDAAAEEMNFTGVFTKSEEQADQNVELSADEQEMNADEALVEEDAASTTTEGEVSVVTTEQVAATMITTQRKEAESVEPSAGDENITVEEISVSNELVAPQSASVDTKVKAEVREDIAEVDDGEVAALVDGRTPAERTPEEVEVQASKNPTPSESAAVDPQSTQGGEPTSEQVAPAEVSAENVDLSARVDTSVEQTPETPIRIAAPQAQAQTPTNGVGASAVAAASARSATAEAPVTSPLEAIRSAIEEGTRSVTAARPMNQLTGTESIASRQGEGSVKAHQEKAVRSLGRVLSTKVLERIEEVLKEAARAKDGKSISFRLDPPQLGAVKVDVTLREGALHARMVAESPAVNQLLRERAPELQAMLRRLGLDVEQVTVAVRGDTPDSTSSRNEGSSFNGFSTMLKDGNSGRGRTGQGRQEVDTVIENPAPVLGVQAGVVDHWVA